MDTLLYILYETSLLGNFSIDMQNLYCKNFACIVPIVCNWDDYGVLFKLNAVYPVNAVFTNHTNIYLFIMSKMECSV